MAAVVAFYGWRRENLTKLKIDIAFRLSGLLNEAIKVVQLVSNINKLTKETYFILESSTDKNESNLKLAYWEMIYRSSLDKLRDFNRIHNEINACVNAYIIILMPCGIFPKIMNIIDEFPKLTKIIDTMESWERIDILKEERFINMIDAYTFQCIEVKCNKLSGLLNIYMGAIPGVLLKNVIECNLKNILILIRSIPHMRAFVGAANGECTDLNEISRRGKKLFGKL
ncbi:MAG: hypothetical protein R6W92_10800 [Desulfocurvibacter africanus]